MTKVVFETATIADVVKKADRVAPGKGKAFDKAAGIVFEISPGDPLPVLVRATNLDIFQMEWVDAVEATGEPTVWRVPSRVLAQVIGSLPIGSGKTVSFEEAGTGKYPHLLIKSGRLKTKFNLMETSYYPEWEAFDPDELMPVVNFGGRVDQVEWAASSGDVPFCAVYLDGKQAIATDRYRLAKADLEIDVKNFPEDGVLIPSGILGQILTQTGEVMIGTSESQLLLMPDEHTQIRATLYDAEYPGVSRIMRREYPQQVKVKKTAFIEFVQRAVTFSGADRFPTLRVFFGQEEIAVMMANDQVGTLGDVMEVPGQCVHEGRHEIKFTPKNLTDAISKSPNDEVTIHYNPDNAGSIVYIDGGSGYEAWVMPRKPGETQEG